MHTDEHGWKAGTARAALVLCLSFTGCAMPTANVAPVAESAEQSGHGGGGRGASVKAAETPVPKPVATPPVSSTAPVAIDKPAAEKPPEQATAVTPAPVAPPPKPAPVVADVVSSPRAAKADPPQVSADAPSLNNRAKTAPPLPLNVDVSAGAPIEKKPAVTASIDLNVGSNAKPRTTVAPIDMPASSDSKQVPKSITSGIALDAAPSPAVKPVDRPASIGLGGTARSDRPTNTASPSIDLFSKIAGPPSAAPATQPSTLSRAQALDFLTNTRAANVAVWTAARPLGFALTRDEAKRQIEQGGETRFVVAPLNSSEPAQMQDELDRDAADHVPSDWLRGDTADAARRDRLARRTAAQDADRAGREKVETSVYDFLLGDKPKPASK